MVKNILIFCVVCISGVKSFGQETKSVKNFAGFFAGVEWNTLSGLVGLDYERTIYQRQKLAIGLKAAHAFKYKLSNLQLLNSTNEGTASFSHLLATMQLFTGKNVDRGFFVHSGLGVGIRKWDYFDESQTSTYPGFEIGFGLQFSLSRDLALKWTNTLCFAGEGGITSTKISFGF